MLQRNSLQSVPLRHSLPVRRLCQGLPRPTCTVSRIVDKHSRRRCHSLRPLLRPRSCRECSQARLCISSRSFSNPAILPKRQYKFTLADRGRSKSVSGQHLRPIPGLQVLHERVFHECARHQQYDPFTGRTCDLFRISLRLRPGSASCQSRYCRNRG